MVQLKEDRSPDRIPDRSPFQFLMVQLKVRVVVIKRTCIFVSIPNGSIKSATKNSNKEFSSTFQFLMVQLKGKRNKQQRSIYLVSIPNGSIKRTDFDSII